MAAVTLPQVSTTSPSSPAHSQGVLSPAHSAKRAVSSPSLLGASSRPGARGHLLKLPSICSSSSSATCGDELGAEHAAFMETFGWLAVEKPRTPNFQVKLAAILETFKFFKELDPNVQANLPSVISTMSKRSGTVLFREGDLPGNCYIVLSGGATIFVKTEEDSAGDASPRTSGIKTVEGFSTYGEDSKFGTQIGLLGPGTLIGELALVNDQPRSATVRCAQDTDFLVIRRSDFDNILKEDMVKKGDVKLRFLMEHVPGMRAVAVPKSGTVKPHASYFFTKASFQRGHCFFKEGAVAEQSIIVMYKGSAECRRCELAPPGVGAPLPSALSTPLLHEEVPGGAKLGNYRRTPGMISRSGYKARLKSLAREQELDETINRLGVLMPGSIFGSLPFQEKEPFTVTVTSQQCEVFVCSGPELSKLPRKLLDTIREYLAHAATWRLKHHVRSQDFRKSRPLDKLVKKRPLLRVTSSPAV